MLTTPPLAPKTRSVLETLGIKTLADLRQTGSVRAFLLLKAAGLTVTQSTLWQLEALVSGRTLAEITAEHKAALQGRLKTHPPVAVFPQQSEMEHFMRLALQQAEISAEAGEIPVGAVIVCQGRVIAQAHNRCVGEHNISSHAEIRALAQAGHALQNYRLEHCDAYITLEPCAMCASALIQARIGRVIYGAPESKTGAAGSVINLFAESALNKHTAVEGGVLADECTGILQRFFAQRRNGTQNP